MAEILIKAIDASNSDPVQDAKCYKRGHPVVVMEDGHFWGREEGLPKFVVIKIPGVSIEIARKFIDRVEDDNHNMISRRMWRIDVASMPLAARNKLISTGTLIIAGKNYSGTRDYTWLQIRTYFKNTVTGLSAADDI